MPGVWTSGMTEDPIALRIFENAMRSSGYFVELREPRYIDVLEMVYTRYVIRDDGGRRAAVGISEYREDDEAMGWQAASRIVELLRVDQTNRGTEILR